MADNVWLTDGGMLPFVTWPLYNRNYWHNTVRLTLNLVDGINVAPAPMQSIGEWAVGESHVVAILNCYPVPPHVPTSDYQIEIICTCDTKNYQGDNLAQCLFSTTIQLRDLNTQSIVMSWTENSSAGTTVYFPDRAITDTYFYGFLGDDDPEYGDKIMWAGIWFDYRYTTDGTYVRVSGDAGIRGDGPGFSRESMRNTYGVDIRPQNGEFDPDVDDPNDDDDGNSGPGGGGGDHNHDTDDIAVPSLPPLSAIDTGFISLYIAGLPAIQALASELWDNSIVAIIEHKFEHPWDYVEGLAICPVTPDWESIVYPKIGSHQLNTTLRLVSNQYVEVDCGSIDINEYYGSSLDYSPYEKIQLHLPYCGSHDLDIDEIMDSTISVKYHVDVLSGACVAFVTMTGRGATDGVRYQYTGDVLSHIPITSRSYDEVLKATAQLGATALATVLAPGPASGASLSQGASKKAVARAMYREAHAKEVQDYNDNMNMATSAANVMGAKPQIMRGGSVSSTMGLLSVQKPFITRTIPRQSLPENYRTYEGYPSNMRESLGSLSGLTKIYSIRPSGFTCTTAELDEIISLLKGGVIL